MKFFTAFHSKTYEYKFSESHKKTYIIGVVKCEQRLYQVGYKTEKGYKPIAEIPAYDTDQQAEMAASNFRNTRRKSTYRGCCVGIFETLHVYYFIGYQRSNYAGGGFEMLYIMNKHSSSDNEFSNKDEAQKALDTYAKDKGLPEVKEGA